MEDKNPKKKEKTIHHYYKKKDIKKDYKFWNTQLVPHFNEHLDIELGPLKSDFKKEDIKQTPYKLSDNME